jgi:Dolichyl-phosphate-mannose-protein mannosyltransferase
MSSALITRAPIPPHSTRAVSRRADLVPLGVITALTLATFLLRLSQMHQSLFGDEVWTYQDITGRGLLGVIRNVHTGAENSPPLFFVLAWLSAKIGDPSVWIRVPSLVLGTLTIPLIYALGRETVGRTPGLVGAAIVGASPFSIYYGIEARPYATMAFFVVLSTWALIRAVRGGGPGWWALYAVAAAGAAYSHYTSVFVLAAQGAWSLWACRGRLRAPLAANALVLLLYLPWLGHIRGKSLGLIGALEPLTAHNVLIDLLRPLAGYPYAPLHAIPGLWGLGVIGACAAVGGVTLIRSRRRRAGVDDAQAAGHLGLLMALTLATPIGLLLYSLLATDLWLARGLYASVPAAALVLGTLVAAPGMPLRAVTTAAVLATLIVGTVRAVSPTYARPPFRTAAEYLDRVARPADPVVMYPSFLHADEAIPAQLKRRHRLLSGIPRSWPTPPAGGADYVVLDDIVAGTLKIGVPRPAGFALAARRHYPGLISFSVLTYRPLRGTRR